MTAGVSQGDKRQEMDRGAERESLNNGGLTRVLPFGIKMSRQGKPTQASKAAIARNQQLRETSPYRQRLIHAGNQRSIEAEAKKNVEKVIEELYLVGQRAAKGRPSASKENISIENTRRLPCKGKRALKKKSKAKPMKALKGMTMSDLKDCKRELESIIASIEKPRGEPRFATPLHGRCSIGQPFGSRLFCETQSAPYEAQNRAKSQTGPPDFQGASLEALKKAHKYVHEMESAMEEGLQRRVAVSSEMSDNLRRVFDSNIGTGFWADKVCSSIARPLNMATYCDAKGVEFEVSSKQASSLLSARPCIAGGGQDPASPRALQRHCGGFDFSNRACTAALKIQRTWRKHHGRLSVSCVHIQRVLRGYRGRCTVHKVRCNLVANAIAIQACARGHFARRALNLLREARSLGASLEALASWDPHRLQANLEDAIAQRELALEHEKLGGAFLGLQAHFRGYLGRRRAENARFLRRAKVALAITLQRIARGRKCRLCVLPVKALVIRGVTRLQSILRGAIQRNRFEALIRLRYCQSMDIQRVVRGFLGRKKYEAAVRAWRAATVINNVMRRRIARTMVKEWRQLRIESEQCRLQVEKDIVANARARATAETKEFLETEKGQGEYKRACRRARLARITVAKAREGMDRESLMKSKAKEAFDVIDEDGSGEIDLGEFSKALRELCVSISRPKQMLLFRTIDSDGSGYIDQQEFTTWFLKGIANEGMDKSVDHVEEGGDGVQDDCPAAEEAPRPSISLAKRHTFKDRLQGMSSRVVGEALKQRFDDVVAAKELALDEFVRLKFRALKKMRDLSGATDRAAAVRSITVAHADHKVAGALATFRKSNPVDLWYQEYHLSKK